MLDRVRAAARLADEANAAAQPDRAAPAAPAGEDAERGGSETSQAVVSPTFSTDVFAVASSTSALARPRFIAAQLACTRAPNAPRAVLGHEVRQTPATPMRSGCSTSGWAWGGGRAGRGHSLDPWARPCPCADEPGWRTNARATSGEQLHPQQRQRARRRVARKIVQAEESVPSASPAGDSGRLHRGEVARASDDQSVDVLPLAVRRRIRTASRQSQSRRHGAQPPWKRGDSLAPPARPGRRRKMPAPAQRPEPRARRAAPTRPATRPF